MEDQSRWVAGDEMVVQDVVGGGVLGFGARFQFCDDDLSVIH